MAWQGSLFDAEGGADLSFDRLVRHRLDGRSWLDEVPGWAPDHAAVLEEQTGAPFTRPPTRRRTRG